MHSTVKINSLQKYSLNKQNYKYSYIMSRACFLIGIVIRLIEH